MSQSFVLSRNEVREFTRSGTRRGQARMLQANGIRHAIDNYGWPVVTRAAVEGERGAAEDRRPWKSNKAA